jgi:hypothetical protein
MPAKNCIHPGKEVSSGSVILTRIALPNRHKTQSIASRNPRKDRNTNCNIYGNPILSGGQFSDL